MQLESMLLLAGKAIMSLWHDQSYKVRTKPDQSLVTDADLASEKVILQEISEYYPGDAVLAEESGLLAGRSEQMAEGDFIWIIDPLDGTTNFANRYPFFCISIARAKKVGDRLEILLGGVYDPVREKMYTAEKGMGATVNGLSIQVKSERSFSDAFLVTGFAYHKGQDLRSDISTFTDIALSCQSIRRDGAAALDLAMVAEGIYDGYWERGLQPWDMAAGSLLVQEAGGIVVNYGSEDFDVTNQTLICGNRVIVRRLQDFLFGK